MLLASRTGGAPDPDTPSIGARPQDQRHDQIAEMIEWCLVAEKECLIDGHGLDHPGIENPGAALHFLHQFADAGQAGLPRQRKQATFNQILLFGSQIETGMLLEILTQVLIFWCHGRPLTGRQNK